MRGALKLYSRECFVAIGGIEERLGWDTIDTHGPDLDFLSNDLSHGRFSLWNPWDKGGYAVYADPVVCRYYPFAWPFIGWGAAFGVDNLNNQKYFLFHPFPQRTVSVDLKYSY